MFAYENQPLGATTIWRILNEAKRPKPPPQVLYPLSRPHQMWFIDHMHLKTLKDGTKVYSLIVLDGWSRVLMSDTICLSKGAREACVILLEAFARWGVPEAILSDNAKAKTKVSLYTAFGSLANCRLLHRTGSSLGESVCRILNWNATSLLLSPCPTPTEHCWSPTCLR